MVLLATLLAIGGDRQVAGQEGPNATNLMGMDAILSQFINPPDSSRPWVYWFVMDGNFSREGITADLEAMKRAGIGGVIFMEVDIGMPRGPVKFMSPEWQQLLKHAIAEAERLGIQISLSTGPGWCGTGGPWVQPDQAMQHLVSSETAVEGPTRFDAVLPQPKPRNPYFGVATLTPETKKQWETFYRDVVVLAFPTPEGKQRIADADEKAIYFRGPYSSQRGVRPFFVATGEYPAVQSAECVASKKVVPLNGKLDADGRLRWDVPAGKWTIMRFGRTLTGQTTRPAPQPGLGLESDKFEAASCDVHFEAFIGTLLKTVGEPKHPGRGLTNIHFDSWEMSSQNWSPHFGEEFRKRRGYDPTPYLPAMSGMVVDDAETSERFLWDLRQTAQELVVENHAHRLRELGRKHGLGLSIEPYDLNPCSDLRLGGAADVPMCEFWRWNCGFATEFSCVEVTSLAHTNGRRIVGAESFTDNGAGRWRQYPANMKTQSDWALCAGVNRITFHRYQHQPWLDRFPGMTMGGIGVQWERTQTWWNMASGFHSYLSRCQYMLRRGLHVADLLYLAPEGAPLVFCPPRNALRGAPPDRLGYGFDACDPETFIERAAVKDGLIVFPDGMSYRVAVLPVLKTMTPRLLAKIEKLVSDGATVIGTRTSKSPSLSDYPKCDVEVKRLAEQLWGTAEDKPGIEQRRHGKGTIVCGQAVKADLAPYWDSKGKRRHVRIDVYPDFSVVTDLLAKRGVRADFLADAELRYIHRQDGESDIYFVANGVNEPVKASCVFRVSGKTPELWDPVTGRTRPLPEMQQSQDRTTVPLEFAPGQSYFVVFRAGPPAAGKNFPVLKAAGELTGPWEVAFDPKWGGPQQPTTFATLQDWTKRPEDGIRHYSGTAVYRKTFDAPAGISPGKVQSMDLGEVNSLAHVKVNDRDLGVVWCAPWRVALPQGLLRAAGNQLEIKVANLWPNRLIKDAGLPEKQRLTSTTWNPYRPMDALLPSGLLGPIRLLVTNEP